MEDGDTTAEFSPSAITRENVEAALKADKGQEAKLLSFSVYEFTSTGDHYATLVAAVEAKYTLSGASGSSSYVVKYHPRRFKAFAVFNHALFLKEEMFYRELLPEIQTQLKTADQVPLRVPKYFHSSLKEGHEVIFLEDLRPRGFKMFDRRKGMDVSHTDLVLKELGRLHAASHLLRSRIPNFCEAYPVLDIDWLNYSEEAVDTTRSIFANQMEVVCNLLKKFGGYELAVNWLTLNMGKAAEIIEKQLQRKPPFDLICHGDCWNNNLLFRYDEEGRPLEVMLLDLQLCRQASVATDLNYFLHNSLEGSVRKPNLEAFLDSYHSAFTEVINGANSQLPFSGLELKQEYDKFLEYGLLLAILIVTIVLTEGGIKGDDMEEFHESLKNRSDDMFTNSPMLRPRFLCIFDEMIEKKVIV